MQAYCDMHTDGGGWILVWQGLATQSRYAGYHDGEKTNLSSNIIFTEIMVEGPNINHRLKDASSKIAVLQKTIPEYFQDVGAMPDSCVPTCPRVYFHNTTGGQDVTLVNNRFFYGYGNNWRFFWSCVDVASPTYMFIGPGAGGCPPRTSFVSFDVGCTSFANNYCQDAANDTLIDSGLKLSKRKYQETKVWVR